MNSVVKISDVTTTFDYLLLLLISFVPEDTVGIKQTLTGASYDIGVEKRQQGHPSLLLRGGSNLKLT